jgi:hypothetical protein
VSRAVFVVIVSVVVAILLAVPVVGALRGEGGRFLLGSSAGLAPAAHPTAKGSSADPFAGTPAEHYASGVAGVVVPAARPIGNWPGSEVSAVLARTKEVLVAARLEPQVIERGDLSGYLALLSSGTRSMVSLEIKKGEPGLGYVTRLAPGFSLASQGVRVSGSMSPALGKDGQLVVTADYVWVYPLRGGIAESSKGSGATLVLLHTVESYEWYRPEGIAAGDRGLRPGGGASYTFNMDCVQVKKGLLALPHPGQGGRPSAPNVDAYDPSTALGAVPTTC